MKKHISKIAFGFSIYLFLLSMIYFILGILDGNVFEFQYILSNVFILGAGVLFLCFYRLIDLLEKNETKRTDENEQK